MLNKKSFIFIASSLLAACGTIDSQNLFCNPDGDFFDQCSSIGGAGDSGDRGYHYSEPNSKPEKCSTIMCPNLTECTWADDGCGNLVYCDKYSEPLMICSKSYGDTVYCYFSNCEQNNCSVVDIGCFNYNAIGICGSEEKCKIP